MFSLKYCSWEDTKTTEVICKTLNAFFVDVVGMYMHLKSILKTKCMVTENGICCKRIFSAYHTSVQKKFQSRVLKARLKEKN